MVTFDDYNIVMKTIGIADLKAHLSEHLKSVRKGRTLTVLDRNTPIARIVPFAAEPLEVRHSRRRPKDVSDLASAAASATPTDSLAVLLEDRGQR